MPKLRSPLGLKKIWGAITHYLSNSSGHPVEALCEDDGTARVQLIGYDGSSQTRIDTEADGELKVVNYGYNGAALKQFLTETDGELKTVFYGKDSDSNIDPLRTNANQQLQVEVVSGSSNTRRVVDAVAVPAAIADVWTPGETSSEYLDFYFEVVNIDGTNTVDVDVGVDLENGGTVDYYFMYQEEIPAGGSVRKGPYRIGGDDAVMANASAASDAVLHIYVTEEGDAAT